MHRPSLSHGASRRPRSGGLAAAGLALLGCTGCGGATAGAHNPDGDAPGALLTGAEADRFLTSSVCYDRTPRAGAGAGGAAVEPAAAPFAQRFGGEYVDNVFAVGVDGAGRTVLASTHYTFVDFGDGVMDAASGRCVFVSSFAANGAHRWTRALALESPDSIAVGADGTIAGVTTFAGYTSAAAFTLSPDGETRWARLIAPVTYYASPVVVGVADDGSVLLRSATEQVVGTGSTHVKLELSALTGAGAPAWSHLFELTGSSLSCVTPAPSGETYVALTVTAPSVIGGVSVDLRPGDVSELVVIRLDASGGVAWVKPFGSAGQSSCSSIAPRGGGGLVLSGIGGAGLSFGGGDVAPPPAPGARSAFLAVLDGRGEHVASRAFPASTLVATSPAGAGTIRAAANFEGTLMVDDHVVRTTGLREQDFFVANLGPTLVLEAIRSYGNGGGSQTVVRMAADPGGAALLAGAFQGKIDLDVVSGAPTTLRSAGATDVFLARLTP